LLESVDVGFVTLSLGFHGVHRASKHVNLALMVCDLLVKLVDGLPVNLAIFLVFIESATKETDSLNMSNSKSTIFEGIMEDHVQ